MNKVVAIPSDKSQPNAEVIEFIEDLLEQAKAGEVQAIFVVTGLANRSETGSGWSGEGYNVMPMLGELSALQHELIARYVEMR